MVEHNNFKVGVELEIEQTSLAKITKQIEKSVGEALRSGVGRAAQGGRPGGAAPPAIPGGTATGRSMAQAATVTQRDFTSAVKEFSKAANTAASRFDDAAATVAASMDRFAKALEASRAKQARSGSSPETRRLAEKQAGPTNKNLARDIQKSRLEAGRQTTGAGGTSERRTDLRTGTGRDKPTYQREAVKREASRAAGRAHPLQAYAEQQAKAVAASLDRLGKTITGLGKLGEIPDILKRIGLPTGKDVMVGEGASAQVKTLAGEAKIIRGHIQVTKRGIEQSTTVSKKINELLGSSGFKETLGVAERRARRDPEGAMAMLRREIRDIFKLPTARTGGAAAYAKAGEHMLEIDFADFPEVREKLQAEKDEAAQIAILNKELWNMIESLRKMGKLPKGIETLGSVGLSEERAAEAKILARQQPGGGKELLGARLPVQVRDIAGMGLGGRGAMRPARSFQPHQARPMVEGERPRIMGKGEALAYETGMYKQEMARHLKTAYVNPKQVPEVSEDMILLDKKAAEKMSAWEPKVTESLKELAEGLKKGQELVQGQVIGYDVEGEEVKFDLKGAKAEVDSIEEVVENGIKGFRIRIKELYEMTTGSKMTTTAGFKGVARVEENMAKKYGLPAGTEAAITGYGAAKRGVLRDPMKMMASEIAKLATQTGGKEIKPQEVANRIEEAMREGGQDLVTAVKQAAEAFGVKGFTGGARGEKAAAMLGELPWMRLKEPRVPGPAEIGTKYYDLPAMQGLAQRADTAKMAQDMVARMEKVTEAQQEFIATLQALAGATDVASEGLREMLPEEFKRLPAGVGAAEQFKGTLLDPEMQKAAAAIRMPTRGGGERLFRMPAMGHALGMRGGFETALGAKGADPISRRIDQMMDVAHQIRMAEGRITPDVTGGGQPAKEAAFKTKEAINKQVEALTQLDLTSKEGAAAASKFVQELLPVIEALNTQLTEPIQFYPLKKGGERRTEAPITVGKTGRGAAEFIKAQPTAQRQLFALQDVLAGRAGRKAGGTENVPTTGEIFKDFELLQKVMETLGVTLEQDSKSVESLYQRLEKLEEGLVSMMAMEAFPGGEPGTEKRRAYAAQLGAGLGLAHKELTAVQFRTDVDEELGQVKDKLNQLAAAGENVDEALAAVDRMAAMQGQVEKIPRDAVFLNRQDYENLVQATMKERGIGRGEAERRLARPGLLQRYPVTGAASFLATRAQVAPEGTVPPGKIGVAGPMAVSSAEDIAAMLKPLRDLERSLYQVIESNQGQGAAAENAKEQLNDLVPVLSKMNQLFLATALNLDFDGDKISWLADTATKAGSDIETFTQRVEKGGVSFQQMMLNVLGKVKGGATGDVSEYAELFGKVAKGRQGELKRAVLMPETGATAQFETQAHIGGKKSVGLLTDAFNKIFVAVTDGSKRAGDAFATGIEYIMLNINKSLAQKGGEGGVAGPLEFIQDIRGGQLQKIFKGMKGKAGLYGEMGEYNRQMRDQMTEGFKGVFMRKGEAGLREVAAAEGLEDKLPQNITFENYTKVIDQMVNELDLEALIMRMFQMMKANMIRALQKEGLTGAEIGEEIGSMLAPDERGRVMGLDVDRMLKQLAPSYMATRKTPVGELRKATPMEQAQEAMKLFPKKVASEVEGLSDKFEIEVDPREEAREIASRVQAWYESIKTSFETIQRQEDLGKLVKGGYSKEQLGRVAGTYIPEEDKVYMSGAKRVQPLLKAIEQLNQIAGGAAATPQQLVKIATAIQQFGTTLAHENVHKASERFTEPLTRIVRSLQSSGTAIGREAPKLLEALSGRVNVRKAKENVKRWEDVASKVGDPNLPELRKSRRNLASTLGTELLAYQTDPAFTKKLREAGISEDALTELTSAFDLLKEAEPQLIKEAMNATRRASEAILTGLMEGLGGGAAPMGGPVAEASRRLEAQEAAVMQGTGALGLPTIGRKEGKLVFPEPLEKIPFAEEFPVLTSRISDVLESARKGFPDLSVMATGEREINQAAGDLQRSMYELERDPESGVGKGTARKLYMKILREFHQAVSVSFINRARALEREIGELKASGKAEKDPGKLRDLLKQLGQVVAQHEEYLARTLKTRGRGRGTVASHIATAGGELVPAAVAAGIKPSSEMLEAEIGQIAGYGKEGAMFMKQMGAAIEYAAEEMQGGRDMTKAWTAVMQSLSEKPELLHTNLIKVAEIFAKMSRHIGFMDGKLSDASQSMMELAAQAKAMARAVEGKPVQSVEEMAAVLAEAPKKARVAAAAGKGGLAESIEAQYKEAEITMKQYQKRLQKIVSTEAYKKAGAPKIFEPITKDIIDPATGKAIQRIRIEAKRMGKQVVTSMTQGGAAANQFGSQMRSALRRVVQWGFASGVVYGLIRAFRNMVSVVTDVQTKIMQLQKVMDTTITDFEAMQDAAVNMARGFGIAVGEVLDGMVVYGQQGLKMNKILERTQATLLAVNVTTLNATEATEALTAAHKVFGHEVSASEEFVDAWGQVAAKHAITAKDLANAVKRSGAAADVAGVSFDDFMGIVTAIGAVTRQTGKEIATSTKFMFRAMRRPTAQKELARIDVKSLLPGGDLRPAMDIFKDIAERWDDLTRAQQINLAQAMAGIRHYNSFIVLMNNFDEAILASAHAQESQGFAVRKNALAMKTFAKQMQVLRETVKKLTLEIGKSVLPMVTGAVKAVSGLVEVLNKIPGPIMTGATALGVLGVAGVKAADLVVDSLDAIFGYGTGGQAGRQAMREKGIFKTAVGGIKGIGKGLAHGEAAEDIGVLGKAAAKARHSFEAFGEGLLATAHSLHIVKAGAKSTAAALSVATVALAAIVAGLMILQHYHKKYTETGHDVAKALEDQIGRSQDAAMQLRSQKTQIDAVTLAYKKIQGAMDRIQTPESLREALNSRTYKSAAVAAAKYGDTVADVAKAIVTVDPAQLQGLSETGEYIVGLDTAFKNLTISAIDARNAITAALQTKVIKAFARDLAEPRGLLDKIAQAIEEFAGGTRDFSLAGEMKQVNKELGEALARRAELAERGVIDVETGQKVVELTQRRAELEENILSTAVEIKKTMEAMPTFENLEMAGKMLGPEMAKAVEAAVPTGVFGRGATLESVMFKQLAKSAGVGGLFGYREAAAPALMAGTLAERGITPTTGAGAAMPKETGAIAVVGTRVAELIAEQVVAEAGQAFETADMGQIARGAQILLADVDKTTGDAVYRFYDGLTRTTREVSADSVRAAVEAAESEVEGQDKKLAAVFALFSRKSMEEAMKETERILNLAFVGAMAGVRQPKGGMPDIGAARKIDLSAEQRAMKELALDMERLGEIQAEMNQLTKEYSEQVLTDVEGAYKTQAKSGQALKAMTADMVELVSQLQEEAFNLSVIVHYQRSIEELGLTMEKAASAAREARIEEDARAEFLVETAGALKGFSEIPQIDFGKTMKELTGAQRLAIEVPGFKNFLDSMKRANREREAAVQQLAEVRKQRARFEEVVKDLAEAGDNLSEAHKKKILERAAKGVDLSTMETIKAIEEGDQATQELLDKQVDLQEKATGYLGDMLKVMVGADKAEIRGKIQRTERADEAEAILKSFGKAAGAPAVEGVTREALGIVFDKLSEKPQFEAGRLPKYMAQASEEELATFKRLRDNYISTLNAGLTLQKLMVLEGKGEIPFRSARAKAKFALAPGEKGGKGRSFETFKTMEDVAQEEEKRLRALMELASVAGALSEGVSQTLTNPAKAAEAAATDRDTFEKKMAKQREDIKNKEIDAYRKFHEAELKIIAGIEQSTKELMAKDPARIAVAARDFANTVENIITEFKKAEALEYTKIKSDLEGPFARVGKPGFKTDFETRREELEKKRMRPMGSEDYRQMQKDLAQVEYDEKEAKIKQLQDVETAALRTQQQQAERLRQAMADALFGGQLEGSPELQKLARNYMDTLTQELATSEQAEMKPGRKFATFRGVPALEDAKRIMEEIKAQAKAKAAEALHKGYRENITQPIVKEIQESNRYLSELVKGAGDQGAAALPPGAVKGMAPMTAGVKAMVAAGLGSSRIPPEMYKMSEPLKGEAPSYETGLTLYPGGRRPQAQPPIVGRSNYIQYLDSAAGRFGNDAATAGVIPRDENRPTSQEDIERRERRRGTTGTSEEIVKGQDLVVKTLEELSSKLDVVVEAVQSTGAIGDKVDAATAAVESLKDGIPVEIGNAIEVSNLGEITDGIQTPLSAVGAELTDHRDTLRKLEGVVDPDGVPVDQRLAELEEDIAARIAETQAEIDAAKVEAIESAKEAGGTAADQQVAALEATVIALSTLLDETIEDGNVRAEEVSAILTELDSARADLEEAKERIESAEEKAGTASDAAAAAEEKAASAEEKATAAEESASSAKTTAEDAQATATAASDANTSLQRDIEVKNARIEAKQRETDTSVERLDVKTTDHETQLREQRGKVERALTIANDARSKIRR